MPADRLIREGTRVVQLHRRGLTFTEIGARLDFSATTAWRRYWWIMDWTLPGWYGCEPGPVPSMRGTKAVPRGRPCLLTLDHGRELMRLHPRPAVRCRAHRRDGKPCGSFAVHGAVICRMHGLNKRARAAAQERHTQAKAAQILARLDHERHCVA